MTINYDFDSHTKNYTCSVCGYKYTKETAPYGNIIEGDDPFIEMDIVLHSDNNSRYYIDHRSHTMYACPKCGVLQIQA